MAFAIGISMEEFKHMTPKELGHCVKGYKLRQRMRDDEVWEIVGNYIIPAVAIGASKIFGKGKTEYPKQPITSKPERISKEQSIEEQRRAFVMRMRAMKANWDINHPKAEE